MSQKGLTPPQAHGCFYPLSVTNSCFIFVFFVSLWKVKQSRFSSGRMLKLTGDFKHRAKYGIFLFDNEPSKAESQGIRIKDTQL